MTDLLKDAETFFAEHPTNRGRGTWMERFLKPEELDAIVELHTRHHSPARIASWLKTRGFKDATGGKVDAYLLKVGVK